MMESTRLINNLDRVASIRSNVADSLVKMAEILSNSEEVAENNSGKFGLDADIEDLKLASKNLKSGVFRLLVLGDMKRGKSTLLNALIGENLLPSDVNPCTALLTVLRYGPEKKVTVYFKEGKLPETIDFNTFKQKYTIDPDEGKKLERENQAAFPNVNYAVVEYPLPLLEKGVEIVDSPGLNDTEARNELSLNYVHNSQAILFVLRAAQPLTLNERRYLDNYIKGRGLNVFFLINGWDEIRLGLVDIDDGAELAEAEAKLRQFFQTNLAEYCQINGANVYDERVFELCSLNALRRRLKHPEDSLEGTGFPGFMAALNTFLTQERAVAELRQARTLARQSYNHCHDAIARRIPLLGEDLQELKNRIASVSPEFEMLTDIRDRFQEEIGEMRDRQAKKVADSFRTYILDLGKTFELDFVRYQPNLGFLDSLQKGKREQFNAEFQQAFERYLNEKIAEWELTAEKQIADAFAQLSQSAAKYGANYTQVTQLINEKLTGEKFNRGINTELEEDAPSWASWAMGFFSLTTGNVAGVVMASAGFDWKNILVNYVAVIGISTFLLLFAGPLASIGLIGIPLLGLGVGALQADEARKEFIKATKKEFIKSLPEIAQSQWQSIYDVVEQCFNDYDREVSKRLNADIKSRQGELDNLVAQKQSQEIDYAQELSRLKMLDGEVLSQLKTIESAYQDLLSSPV